MRHVSLSRSALLLAVLGMAACSGSETSPSPPPAPGPGPTPTPTPTVTSVAVTSARMSASTYQLRAEARLSDGATRDVTSAADWQSSNTAIARIAPGGTLTALHDGTVEVRATYENVTGSTSLTLALPFFSVSGLITEAAPSSKVLEGVRVNVTAGSNEGEFTYSDDRGLFTLNGLLAGTVELSVTRDGYQPWSQRFTLDQNVTNLPIVLYPVAPSAERR